VFYALSSTEEVLVAVSYLVMSEVMEWQLELVLAGTHRKPLMDDISSAIWVS
jgi:hypothetical protein